MQIQWRAAQILRRNGSEKRKWIGQFLSITLSSYSELLNSKWMILLFLGVLKLTSIFKWKNIASSFDEVNLLQDQDKLFHYCNASCDRGCAHAAIFQ